MRISIANFYSSLDNQKAKQIYIGYSSYQPDRWIEAYKINSELLNSRACIAIKRYSGSLYINLDKIIKDKLADGSLDNILIISALHGPTHPMDYLPFYDLTMRDLWCNTRMLKDMWPIWIKKFSSDYLKEFLENFDNALLLLNNDYKPAAMVFKELVPRLKIKDLNIKGKRAANIINKSLIKLL